MTTPPYARLGVRVNGAAPQYGGITVAHGDMVQFVAESTAYWGTPAAVWQIFDYPQGWTGPGAPWVSTTIPQANGLPDAVVFQYTGNTAPPPFVMPALPYWGKFMPSLFVNGGTIQGVAAAQLYDESTAVQILSPNALVETAFRETSQYGSWRGFAGVLKALVRLIDGLFSSVPTLSNATPQAVGTATAGVAAAASRADHVHAHGNQASDGSFHAAAIASGAAGFMTGVDKAKLDNAATVATASTLVLRGASGEAAFAYLYDGASLPTTGFLRHRSGFTYIASTTAAGGFDNEGFTDDGSDGWKIGNQARAAMVRLSVKTGGSATWEVNNVVEGTMDAGGLNLSSGNTYQINGVDVIPNGKPQISLTQADTGGGMQAFTAGVSAEILFNTEVFKDGITHSTSVNPQNITIVDAGIYAITCGATVDAAVGLTGAELVIAAGSAGTFSTETASISGRGASVMWSGALRLAAADVVTASLVIYGANSSLTEDVALNYMVIHRINGD